MMETRKPHAAPITKSDKTDRPVRQGQVVKKSGQKEVVIKKGGDKS